MVTHIASLTPSVELHHVCTRPAWSDDPDDHEDAARIEEWVRAQDSDRNVVDYTDARPFWRSLPVDEQLVWKRDGQTVMRFIGTTDAPSEAGEDDPYETQLETLLEHVTCNELI